MSFHGGMLGVASPIILFCRRKAIPLLGFADRIAVVAPIGLGLGRVRELHQRRVVGPRRRRTGCPGR